MPCPTHQKPMCKRERMLQSNGRLEQATTERRKKHRTNFVFGYRSPISCCCHICLQCDDFFRCVVVTRGLDERVKKKNNRQVANDRDDASKFEITLKVISSIVMSTMNGFVVLLYFSFTLCHCFIFGQIV